MDRTVDIWHKYLRFGILECLKGLRGISLMVTPRNPSLPYTRNYEFDYRAMGFRICVSLHVSKSHVAPRPPRRYFTNFLAYGYSVWDYDARAMVQGLWCMVHRCYGAKCMKRNDICQPRSLPVTPTSGHGHFRPPIAYSYGVWGYGAQAMVHRLWCMVHKCYGMLQATPTSGHAHFRPRPPRGGGGGG